jgi:5-formyltetrahydrofolate cyclo-ligase
MTLADDSHKQQLRAHYLMLRKAITAGEAERSALQLAQHVASFIPDTVQIIAAYTPVRSEIDVLPACVALVKTGRTICLPVIMADAQPLSFRRWNPGEALVSGRHGIAVPPESEPEVQPDMVLVPLLAFDAKGHRLGYGAGYYDRTIAALHAAKKRPLCVGVGYDLQQAELLPTQAHDEQLDAVITPLGMMRFT